MTTAEQVYVTVGFSDDYEQPYVLQATGPEDDDRPQSFVFAIDPALWQRYEETLKAWQEAEQAIYDATPYDTESGRLEACCEAWRGYLLPGHVSWIVVLAASGNEEEWPRGGDANITYAKTEEQAVALIAELPEEFFVHMAGAHLQKVLRSNLSVHRSVTKGYADRCHNCGWDRTEHPNAGEPIVRDMPQFDDADEPTRAEVVKDASDDDEPAAEAVEEAP